jgi:hypothetical protein
VVGLEIEYGFVLLTKGIESNGFFLPSNIAEEFLDTMAPGKIT